MSEELEEGLYIVATPIGNLKDISERALYVLENVDYILAENTKHTKKLLDFFEIRNKLKSYHQHNEASMVKKVVDDVTGKKIALVSDAGTPLISDPGYKIVKELHNHNIKIIPISGPCAAISALCASGMNTESFIFEGFLPAKSVSRKNYLTDLKFEKRTMIFYEAPHRIEATVQDMLEVFGPNRMCTLAREISKMHETIVMLSLEELSIYVTENITKGEMVLILEGSSADELDNAQEVLRILLDELPVKQASKLASEITKISKSKLYKIALEMNKN